jgi:hypothetical protein
MAATEARRGARSTASMAVVSASTLASMVAFEGRPPTAACSCPSDARRRATVEPAPERDDATRLAMVDSVPAVAV